MGHDVAHAKTAFALRPSLNLRTLCVNLFIICFRPLLLSWFLLLFVGYKKMRHKKADMARRADWPKIVNIRTNKRRNNFRKIFRPRKKGVCKSYF